MELLHVLGAPRRREILRLVWRQERSAGDIHRALGDVTFGAVSQHLRVLEAAGLVAVRPEGRLRFYRARPNGLGPFRSWLEAQWDDALYRLRIEAELLEARRGPRPRRERQAEMSTLPHVVERRIVIRAERTTVFRFFQESALWAKWWGKGSSIESRQGGRYQIRYPNGIGVSGEVLEIMNGERIVLSYGYDEPGQPIPPGGSRVHITLSDHRDGTLLTLRHELASTELRDAHVQGWRYQLALFANVATAEQHRDATATVDRYFGLWGETEPSARRQGLAEVCVSEVALRDSWSCTDGLDELAAQVQAAQIHMPGVRLERSGEVRVCQGTAVVEWKAADATGAPRGGGVNVFELDPAGRIARIVGFWNG